MSLCPPVLLPLLSLLLCIINFLLSLHLLHKVFSLPSLLGDIHFYTHCIYLSSITLTSFLLTS